MKPISNHKQRFARARAAGALCAGLFFVAVNTSVAVTLNVRVAARFNDAPLVLDSLVNTTAAGQAVSVTRLDFLLSNFALHEAGGGWTERTNTFAYVSVREGRTTFSVENVPAGSYDRIRFHVGLEPAINHSDPAKFPAAHPLNAVLNGLHWNWQGGYVFLAMEGRWRLPDGSLGGYSHHIANDARLMTVSLPVALSLPRDAALDLALHVDRIWSGKSAIKLSPEAVSTHSREGDVLAAQLAENIQAAFAVGVAEPRVAGKSDEPFEFRPPPPRFGRPPPLPPPFAREREPSVALPKGTTPYRLTFGRQFPIPDLPRDNPLTEQGVALGRQLFNDPILSINGKQSCSSCHQADAAFTDKGRAASLGAEGQAGTRNAMPLFNLAWNRSFFWDGRARTLREQVLMPIQNPIEMHESLTNVVRKLENSASKNSTNYPALFARAFGSQEIAAERIAMALEQFLVTLVSDDSRFDRVMQGREQPSEDERRGFELFNTEFDPRRGLFGADCFHCHGGPFFTNHRFANNGLDAEPRDTGRLEVTKNEHDRGLFAVPSLRNVALTAPYMHDGRFKTLEEVVEHYSTGVRRSATLDPNLAKHPVQGLQLSVEDKRALMAFLRMLTDESLSQRNMAKSDPDFRSSGR